MNTQNSPLKTQNRNDAPNSTNSCKEHATVFPEASNSTYVKCKKMIDYKEASSINHNYLNPTSSNHGQSNSKTPSPINTHTPNKTERDVINKNPVNTENQAVYQFTNNSAYVGNSVMHHRTHLESCPRQYSDRSYIRHSTNNHPFYSHTNERHSDCYPTHFAGDNNNFYHLHENENVLYLDTSNMHDDLKDGNDTLDDYDNMCNELKKKNHLYYDTNDTNKECNDKSMNLEKEYVPNFNGNGTHDNYNICNDLQNENVIHHDTNYTHDDNNDMCTHLMNEHTLYFKGSGTHNSHNYIYNELQNENVLQCDTNNIHDDYTDMCTNLERPHVINANGNGTQNDYNCTSNDVQNENVLYYYSNDMNDEYNDMCTNLVKEHTLKHFGNGTHDDDNYMCNDLHNENVLYHFINDTHDEYNGVCTNLEGEYVLNLNDNITHDDYSYKCNDLQNDLAFTYNSHTLNENCNNACDSVQDEEMLNYNVNSMHGITVAFVNVNSLPRKSKYPEFIEFMNRFNVIALAETKCSPNFEISGYKIFHKQRKDFSSGGISIAIKNQLIPYVKEIETSSNHVLWVQIKKEMVKTKDDLIIGACYIPPANSRYYTPDAFIEIEAEMTDYFYKEKSILLIGDLNAKTQTLNDLYEHDHNENDHNSIIDLEEHDCIVNLFNESNLKTVRSSSDRNPCNRSGYKLIDFCKTCNFFIVNGRCPPDFAGEVTCNDSSLVDYAILNVNSLYTFSPTFEVLDYSNLLSDVHKAICIRLDVKQKAFIQPNEPVINRETPSNEYNEARPSRWKSENAPTLINNFDKNTITTLNNALSELDLNNPLSRNRANYVINSTVTDLNKNIIEAARKTSGIIYHKNYNNTSKLPRRQSESWFNDECKKARNCYNIARKQYNRTKRTLHYKQLQEASRLYKYTMNKAINSNRIKVSQNLKNTRFHNPKEFWKTYNEGKNTKHITAECKSLYEHFKRLAESIPEEDNNVVFDSVPPSNDTGYDILHAQFQEDEIKKRIPSLKNGKSPGDDLILNEYIKTLSNLVSPLLVNLFNKILSSGVYPDAWTLSVIVPVFKDKGDAKDPANYRPISLTSCISKLFSMLLNDRLQAFLDQNDTIDSNQGAFTPGNSTTTHLFSLHCLIEYSKYKKSPLYCAFLDLSRAYDSVWRNGMLHKMSNINIQGPFFNLIKSMYNVTRNYVRCNGTKSREFISNIGIKQGCNLSCLLFIIYLNDLEKTLKETRNCKGICILDDDNATLLLELFALLYADDTVILAKSQRELQTALNSFSEYCKKWKLKTNILKSKVLVFGRDRKPVNLKINGQIIERVKSFKYLGIIFTKSAKYAQAIKENLLKAQRASFSVMNRARELNLSLSCTIHIINTVIKPILLYGCEIFCYGNTTSLEKFYVSLLKRALSLRKSTPSYMVYGETGCMPLKVDIRERAACFWLRISSGKDKLLAKQLQNILLKINSKDDYESPYLKYMFRVFNELGLTYLLSTQNTTQTKYHCDLIKQRSSDQYRQEWTNEINESSKSSFYKMFKHDLSFENYLDILPFGKRTALLKFRTTNHRLPIEVGRWEHTYRELRRCIRCNTNALGDEYHYLMECPYFATQRKQFLTNYFTKNHNTLKVSQLFNTRNNNILRKLSTFAKIIISKFGNKRSRRH